MAEHITKRYYIIYAVTNEGVRVNCQRAKRGTTEGHKKGWLSYELSDGTTGLARPGTWEEMTAEFTRVEGE